MPVSVTVALRMCMLNGTTIEARPPLPRAAEKVMIPAIKARPPRTAAVLPPRCRSTRNRCDASSTIVTANAPRPCSIAALLESMESLATFAKKPHVPHRTNVVTDNPNQIGISRSPCATLAPQIRSKHTVRRRLAHGGEDGTPAGTRTRARGLGNRCSIRLSYRGVLATMPSYRHSRCWGEGFGERWFGGDTGTRTPNLRIANAALSQLSYTPTEPGAFLRWRYEQL